MKRDTIKMMVIYSVIALMFAFSVSQMLSIMSLSKKIETLELEIDYLSQEIQNNTHTNIITEKQEELIIEWDYGYQNLNTEEHTVDFYLKVLPKTIVDGMKVTFSYDDNIYEMTQEGNYYMTTIPLYLFSSVSEEPSAYVIIERDGEKKLQRFTSMYTNELYNNYLPSLTKSGSSSWKHNNNETIITYDYNISIEKNGLGFTDVVDFKKIEIVTEINNEIVEREDITKEVNEQLGKVSVFGGGISDSKTYSNLEEDDTVHLYFEATDEYGYIHRETINIASFNENKQWCYNIYDKDGNALINYD